MFIVQFHPWAKIVSNDGVRDQSEANSLEDRNRQQSTDPETPVVSPVTELEDGQEDPAIAIPQDAAEEIVKPPADEERKLIVSWIISEILGETVSDEKENDLSPEEDSSPDQNNSSEEKPMAEDESDLDSYLKLLQEMTLYIAKVYWFYSTILSPSYQKCHGVQIVNYV